MMISGRKSWMICTCRAVMPPDAGITVHPARSGAVVRAEASGEQPVAVGRCAPWLARPAARGRIERAMTSAHMDRSLSV